MNLRDYRRKYRELIIKTSRCDAPSQREDEKVKCPSRTTNKHEYTQCGKFRANLQIPQLWSRRAIYTVKENFPSNGHVESYNKISTVCLASVTRMRHRCKGKWIVRSQTPTSSAVYVTASTSPCNFRAIYFESRKLISKRIRKRTKGREILVARSNSSSKYIV